MLSVGIKSIVSIIKQYYTTYSLRDIINRTYINSYMFRHRGLITP